MFKLLKISLGTITRDTFSQKLPVFNSLISGKEMNISLLLLVFLMELGKYKLVT